MSRFKIFKEMMPEQFKKLANGEYDDFEVLVQITDRDGTIKVTPLTMINPDERLKTIWFAGNISKDDKEYFDELNKMHQELRKKTS